jgi:hypothetical protein
MQCRRGEAALRETLWYSVPTMRRDVLTRARVFRFNFRICKFGRVKCIGKRMCIDISIPVYRLCNPIFYVPV